MPNETPSETTPEAEDKTPQSEVVLRVRDARQKIVHRGYCTTHTPHRKDQEDAVWLVVQMDEERGGNESS